MGRIYEGCGVRVHFYFAEEGNHRYLSVGACFIMMLSSVSSFASIDIGVRGLCDLSISSLVNFIMRVWKEFGFWFEKFAIVLIGCTISRTPIAFGMFEIMFQTGLT